MCRIHVAAGMVGLRLDFMEAKFDGDASQLLFRLDITGISTFCTHKWVFNCLSNYIQLHLRYNAKVVV